MRIGVYVGSFNPPHLGHQHVVDYLLEKDLVDLVLLLPTPNYWDKNNLVSIQDRVEMLKYYEDEKVKVDQEHNAYPFTYQVLDSLEKDYPNDELYLIIGSDNIERFHEWKNVENILKHYVIVLKRGDYKPNPHLSFYKNKFIYQDDFEPISISSTDIRNGVSGYLKPEVEDYIKNHLLYKEN